MADAKDVRDQGGRGGPAQPPPPPADPKYTWPQPQTVLGTHVKRLDGPEKVTGRAKYTFDVKRPGMLYGAHRPFAASARADRVDRSVRCAARARGEGGDHRGAIRQTPSANRHVQGDEVAAVAADTEERAIDAARLVKVEYEVLPQSSRRRSGARRHRAGGVPRRQRAAGRSAGDGRHRRRIQAAAHTLEETYATHVITHVCLESHGAVCEWDGDHLTAWVSTQGDQRRARRVRQRAEHSAGQRARDLPVHGRRLRQQAGSSAPQGLICARLAKEANAPVKLMLDRKEEHLATGNRPSAAARVKAGVAADGMLTAFDAESWGTGGAGAAAGFPLPYIYQIAEPAPHAQGRLHQHRPAAPDARPGPPAGVVHHRNDDGRARRPREDGSGRVPDQEPAARSAERDVAAVSARRARRSSAGSKRHPTGDPTPGPIKTGMGVAINTWGGGGRGPSQAHCEIASDGSVVVRVGTQDHRHRHADAGRGRGGRYVRPAGRRRSRRRSATRCIGVSGGVGRQHDRRGGQPGGPDRDGQRARRTEGEGRAGAGRRGGRRWSRPAAASRCKDNPSKGMSWADACKQIGAAADFGRRRLAAGAVVGHDLGRAVRRSDGRHRDRHRQGHARARASRTAASSSAGSRPRARSTAASSAR